MGSDRIITKQGKSLVVLSLNWYVMTQIVYVSHFHQNQYFLLRYFGEETCKFKETPKFFTRWHLKDYNKFHGNLISHLKKFIENEAMITI